MPPPLLFDLDAIDLNGVQFTQDQIYARLPHRFEFKLLGGIIYLDMNVGRVVSFYDCREDSWWTRGHVPERPLLPGILMLEMAAQTAAFAAQLYEADAGFMAFGGLDGCKFREAVFPGERMYILAEAVEHRRRKIVSRTQGIKSGRVVFEAQITGLIMR